MKIPLGVEVKDKRVLVIGNGKTGKRRSKVLREAGANVTIEENLKSIDLKEKIKGFDMILACTDDTDFNKEIITEAQSQGKLSASVEKDKNASLSFPAVFKEDGITAAFFTDGEFPGLSKYLKEEFKKYFNKNKERFRLLILLRKRVLDAPKGFDKESYLKELFNKSTDDLRLLGHLPEKIKVATRGSKLALAQTESVIKKIEEKFPFITFETVVISTKGDKDRTTPLREFKDKNIFSSGLEEALLKNKADLAVHSLKDLPVKISAPFIISPVPPKREDPGEAFLLRKEVKGKKNLKIGTGSLRRETQLKKLFPDAKILPIRGNVPTRIEKLKRGEFDGIVLAKAGLNRLGITKEALKEQGILLVEPDLYPALRQGMLGLEFLEERYEISEILKTIGDPRTGKEFEFENGLLMALEAGCETVVGGKFIESEGKTFFKLYFKPDSEKEEEILEEQEITGSGRDLEELIKKVKLRIEREEWST